VLHFQQGRLAQARADLEQALRDGAEPDAAHYNLALVALAAHDRPAALDHLEQTLRLRPAHAEARSLRELLLRQK
jgi:tetratricopeptide (TPR) repeat protein